MLRGSIAISGDRIDAVVEQGGALPDAERVVDLDGAYLAPGLIDLHIHGAAGVDVMTADETELRRLGGWLAGHGVTRFLPTLVSTSLAEYEQVAGRIATWIGRAMLEPAEGAVPVGLHFEGPFLNAARCGALDAARFLTGADLDDFFARVGTARIEGLPSRMITVAPEIDGGLEVVRGCVDRGFVASIGHTQADVATLEAAVDAGASHMTHFMNAMPQLHHRAPGPVGWGLVSNRVSVDLIADYEHVHPDVLRLVVATKSSSRVALISDAVPAAGLGDGEFTFWGERVTVRGRRTENDRGGIAGSVITLRDAVENITRLGVPITDAVRMASLVPARILGLEAFGAIAAGKIADCVAFHDELEPFLTVVAGRVVHHIH